MDRPAPSPVPDPGPLPRDRTDAPPAADLPRERSGTDSEPEPGLRPPAVHPADIVPPSLVLDRSAPLVGRRPPRGDPDRSPEVTVTIGRIEVVNPAPPAPAPPTPGPRRAPHAPQLADYLSSRRGR